MSYNLWYIIGPNNKEYRLRKFRELLHLYVDRDFLIFQELWSHWSQNMLEAELKRLI